MSESPSSKAFVWGAVITALGTVVVTMINRCPATPEKPMVVQPSVAPDSIRPAQHPTTVNPGPPRHTGGPLKPGTATPPQESKAFFSGRLVDADGRSVAGASVRCANCPDSDRAVTDRDGYFKLDYPVEPGNSIQQLELLFSKDGRTKTSVESATQKNATIQFEQ